MTPADLPATPDLSEVPTEAIIAELHRALARLTVAVRLAGLSREPIRGDA